MKILKVVMAVGLSVPALSLAGDVTCTGQTNDARPFIIDIRGEGPAADSSIANLEVQIYKNGSRLYVLRPQDRKATSVVNDIATFNLPDDREMFAQLLMPADGQGAGQALLKDTVSKSVVKAIPFTCSKTDGLSFRQQNDLCVAAAEKAAEDFIQDVGDEPALTGNMSSMDAEGNDIDMTAGFSGIYIFEYSFNEECMDGVRVETRLTTDKNGQPRCEVIEAHSDGSTECG